LNLHGNEDQLGTFEGNVLDALQNALPQSCDVFVV
jgi:hypothetical protein